MAATDGGPTGQQISQDRLLAEREGVDLPIRVDVPTENVGDLDLRARLRHARWTSGMHLRRGSAESFASRRPDQIDGALDRRESRIAQMQVARGALQRRVPEQHLDRAHVRAHVEQMRRKRVTWLCGEIRFVIPAFTTVLRRILWMAVRLNRVPRRPERNPGKSSGPVGRSTRQ